MSAHVGSLIWSSKYALDRSSTIGKLIDAYLKGESRQEDHVIHLLFSANRWEAAAQIKLDIANGVTIVIDRYYYSGIVYSAAKHRSDLSLEWARRPEVGLPQPDVWFFLKIAPKDASARGGFGKEKYENQAMQERVEEMFRRLSETSDGADMRTIDAGSKLNEVEDAIWGVVQKTLEDPRMTGPLRSVGS